LLNAYNSSTHALVKSIPLTGEEPRALAVSPDGSMVYTAFALSGNHSTLVPATQAPPHQTPLPSDFNPQLPTPPTVGLIVDASDPAWTGVIQYTMPDNDVAAINAHSFDVTYYSHLGTDNMGLAVSPKSGNLYVANMDALNLVNFENVLNGHLVNHRITYLNVSNGNSQFFDLNPGIDYGVLPNPAALATALAMPTALVFDPTGRYLYIAAFGTDRIGIFDGKTNTVTSFIEIDPQATGSTVNSVSKRGPRGLALTPSGKTLYVLNRLSNTISVVNLSNNTVTEEIATGSYDPTPTVVRNGRGFLYDHKLSGNGTAACATCHIDAELDLLSWNLGDPTGSMTTLQQGSQTFSFHPMKGPMTTQALRGLANVEPYHWRGDKPNLAAFNGAFAALMGGSQLSDSEMAAFTNFVNTIVYQPNPNLNLDDSFPATVALPDKPGTSASPSSGQTLFLTQQFTTGANPSSTCNSCHTADPGVGSNLQVRIPVGKGPSSQQPFKIPHLRNMYWKTNTNFTTGAASVNGFGYNHDGAISGLINQADQNSFGIFANNPPFEEQIEAFELCFDTGTPAATGYSRTVTKATVSTSPAQSDWTTLQTVAAAGKVDLIANGTIQGQVHGLLYQPATSNYETDTTGLGPFTQAQLTTFVKNGDTLTLMAVPAGSGTRMAIDRNLDGKKNGDGN
jgi:YVTN family beta-propeller protein